MAVAVEVEREDSRDDAGDVALVVMVQDVFWFGCMDNCVAKRNENKLKMWGIVCTLDMSFERDRKPRLGTPPTEHILHLEKLADQHFHIETIPMLLLCRMMTVRRNDNALSSASSSPRSVT
nr:hypothetical protein CFP56_59613 [Quercus suber]